MYPYFDPYSLILYVIVGLSGAYALNLSVNYKKTYPFSAQTGYVLFYILFVLLAVARLVTNGIVGTDALSYEDYFQYCLRASSRFDEEDILFGFFTKIIRTITSNVILYRLICYSMITVAYLRFIRSFCIKGASCIPFIVLLLPYLKSLNTMRTSLAIAMVLIGVVWLKERKIYRGIIIICLSIFVHRMSIIYVMFLPFYAIFRNNRFLNSNIKLISVILIISATGYYLASQIQQYVLAASLLEEKDIY